MVETEGIEQVNKVNKDVEEEKWEAFVEKDILDAGVFSMWGQIMQVRTLVTGGP